MVRLFVCWEGKEGTIGDRSPECIAMTFGKWS